MALMTVGSLAGLMTGPPPQVDAGQLPGQASGYNFFGMAGQGPTYNYLGATGQTSGYLNQAVWNLNASPWNNVHYGQIQATCGCQPYNGVQYQAPVPPPPQYAQPPMGCFDVSQALCNPYVYGSQAAYQGYFQAGFYAQSSFPIQSFPCQPAYQHPQAYAPPFSQPYSYGLEAFQAGLYCYGSRSVSSYQPYDSHSCGCQPPTPLSCPPPTGGVEPYAQVQNGQVAYPNLPPFESVTSWASASQVVAQRLTGDPGAQATYHFSSTDPRLNHDGRANERTTVWWALQQNDRLRFDANSKNFFLTYPDGSTRNVETLANLMSVRQASGWDGQVAYKAFGDRIQEVLVTNDLIYPPYQPGATALTTNPFGTQWDSIFPRPDMAGHFGYPTVNLPPGTTWIPPNGLA
ncbi:hypothetical protein DYH09_19450 [bacterium CPR1]|nr:hypothetical protein [bacterium CPR1]